MTPAQLRQRRQHDKGNNPSTMLAKTLLQCRQQHGCTKDSNTSTNKQGQSCHRKDGKDANATRALTPAK
jgi:hypothetical protein